jgi:hypothetical protein
MMRLLTAAMIAFTGSIVVLSSAAQAQNNNGIPCESFVKNPDGSWSALEDAPILGTGQKLTIRAGSVLRPGAAIMGLDLATILTMTCPAQEAVASAPAAAAISLGRYGDGNGNIDVEKLNCEQIAGAAPEEAELLLAWYGGWYNGAAKKRGINLTRVRYAIRNVIDYCKGNRDKKLVRVMELMLK